MIHNLKAFLQQQGGDWGLPGSGEWRPMIYNNYHPHCSDIDVFWFHNGGESPRLVTKFSNGPGPAEREFVNLRRVHSLSSAAVPRPLHFTVQDGQSTLWMEGVPGTQFRADWNREALASFMGLLTRIHTAVTERTPGHSPERWVTSVQRPLRALAGFGASAAVREGCADLERRAGMEWLSSMPVIPQHGDLYVGNVLYAPRQWFIVDWESFGLVDLPVHDVYTFLLSILRADGNRASGWREGIATSIPSVVAEYARGLQLSSAALRLLLPIALANWFHVQWSDGRREFAVRFYEAVTDYFEHPDAWERIFIPGQEQVQ